MRHRLIFAILFFTWLAALLVLTYYPHLPDIKVRVRNEWFRLDYAGHLGFYAGLIALFLIWRAGWRTKISVRLMFWTTLSGLVLGTANEFAQLAIPGRSCNLVDLACNFAGILAGVAAVYALSWKVNNETVEQ
jgi:VanZ family protein